MRPTSPIPLSALILTSVAITASSCGDLPEDVTTETSKAISARPMGLFIPAYYFDSDTFSWDALLNERSAHSLNIPMWVVVNGPNNGPPGPNESPNLASHIQALVQRNVYPLGYVKLGAGPAGAATANMQIDQWINAYKAAGLKGIYFDEAGRTDTSDLARFEFLAQKVYTGLQYVGQTMCNPGGCFPIYYPGLPAFGWGTSPSNPGQTYFECVLRNVPGLQLMWLSLEQRVYRGTPANFNATSYDDLFATGDWSWIKNYHPQHFIQLAHTFFPNNDLGRVDSMAAQIRTRGAYSMHFTNCRQANYVPTRFEFSPPRFCNGGEWGQSPNGGLLPQEFNVASQTFSDYTGSNTDNFQLPNNCPAPSL
jgi:hypothetical protein